MRHFFHCCKIPDETKRVLNVQAMIETKLFKETSKRVSTIIHYLNNTREKTLFREKVSKVILPLGTFDCDKQLILVLMMEQQISLNVCCLHRCEQVTWDSIENIVCFQILGPRQNDINIDILPIGFEFSFKTYSNYLQYFKQGFSFCY